MKKFNYWTSEGAFGIFKSKDYVEKTASRDILRCSQDSLGNVIDKNAIKEPIWKCRYIVTLLTFLVNFQLSCFRINTSVSIVAMVNSTAVSLNDSLISSVESCPSNLENLENNSTNHNEGNFDWNPEIQGYILGSALLGYVVTQMPGGIMSDKISAKMTIILGVLLQTICHLSSPISAWTSSNLLIVVQFIFGLGQGLTPAASCVLAANWLPIHERGLLNTIIAAGCCVGALVGGAVTGTICSSPALGWEYVYYIFGGFGLILTACLQIFLFESPKAHPRISESELKYITCHQELDFSGKRPPIPWKKIFSSGPFYALTIARTGQFWMAVHFFSVNPTFLGTILHYPIRENGVFASAPYILQTFLAVFGSWVSGWLNKHNYVGVDKVRKGCNFLSCLGYSLCLLGMYFAGCNKSMSAPFSIIALGFVGLSYAGSMMVAVDMCPTFAGTVTGISSIVSSLPGFIMPILVGLLTKEEQTLEQWNKVFFISIGFAMISGLIFVFFGSANVQEWNFPVSKNSADLDEKKIEDKVVGKILPDFDIISNHI